MSQAVRWRNEGIDFVLLERGCPILFVTFDEAQRGLAIQLDVEIGASDGPSFERLQCIFYSAERAGGARRQSICAL